MRVIVTASIIALCVAGAAFAQQGPLVFTPAWDVEPTPGQNVTHYPAEALRQNVSGIAVLCCTPGADRSIDCVVSSEWPNGHGFGDAAVRASRAYRLTAQSHADLVARPAARVRLSMQWGAPIISDQTRYDLAVRDRNTAHACLAPPA